MQALYIALDGSFRVEAAMSDGHGKPLRHVRRPVLRRAAEDWRMLRDADLAQPVPYTTEDYRMLGTAACGKFAVYEQV